ncbi:protealysin inhibitor emfourin [Actinomycetota bacterium]
MTHCQIIPPYILEHVADHGDPETAARARETLRSDATFRHQHRAARAEGKASLPGGTPGVDGPNRRISDAKGVEKLPGTLVRGEGSDATGDVAADEAYDGLGATWELLNAAFGRNSLDGKGLPLLGTVHYGTDYDNAFWDGTQMVFGDGDGKVFGRFTASIDVIGHELGHGVTEHTAGLLYQGQSGALNESMSDVFGSLVRQHISGQSAADADWLIGAELLMPGVKGVALRSMREPGTAYDDPVLGKDPQPGHMRDYVETTDDNGGVHINSGIPNRAYYLAATAIGGNAWETVGPVWYAALTGPGVSADCDFVTFAGLVVEAARKAWGAESSEAAAVEQAWRDVGVLDGSGAGEGEPAERGGQAPGGGPADGVGDEADGPVGDVPAADAELLVRRSGGFAGRTQEVRTRLADLPDDDTQVWQTLLGSRTLQRLAMERSPEYRDAYIYRVACAEAGVDVTVPDPELPDGVRDLFQRTLKQA